jgi:rubrerythrin
MHKMTEENLKAAFAGESQAHMKYLNFSAKAQQEGLANIARLFAAASYAEQVHASAHLRVLGGTGSTVDNLAGAIEGEGFEVAEMYPAFMSVAETQAEQGANTSFYRANEAEKVHKTLYTAAREAAMTGKDAELGDIYVCPVCGFTAEGAQPDKCPLCGASGERMMKF